MQEKAGERARGRESADDQGADQRDRHAGYARAPQEGRATGSRVTDDWSRGAPTQADTEAAQGRSGSPLSKAYDRAQRKRDEAQALREEADIRYSPALPMPPPQDDKPRGGARDDSPDKNKGGSKGLLEKAKEVLHLKPHEDEPGEHKGLFEKAKETLLGGVATGKGDTGGVDAREKDYKGEEAGGRAFRSDEKDADDVKEGDKKARQREKIGLLDSRWRPHDDEPKVWAPDEPLGGPDIEEVDVLVPLGGLLTSTTDSMRELLWGGGKGHPRPKPDPPRAAPPEPAADPAGKFWDEMARKERKKD